MSEEADAVVAIAETTNNAIDKTAELSCFIGKIFGAAIEDIGAITAQYTTYWRIRNALRLRDKLNNVINERGYTALRELPLRIGLPLLDAALNEDNDTLQNLWANLLASAMAEKNSTSITKSYVETLKQLDIIDAELLNMVFMLQPDAIINKKVDYAYMGGDRNGVEMSVAVHNLERLGLIDVHQSNTEKCEEVIITLRYFDKENKAIMFTMFVSLTLFGFHFMRACTDKKPLVMKDGTEAVPIDHRFEYPPRPTSVKS